MKTDSAIELDVLDELAWVRSAQPERIGVSVQAGIVTLACERLTTPESSHGALRTSPKGSIILHICIGVGGRTCPLFNS